MSSYAVMTNKTLKSQCLNTPEADILCLCGSVGTSVHQVWLRDPSQLAGLKVNAGERRGREDISISS